MPGCEGRQRLAGKAERGAQHQAKEIVQRFVVGFVHRLGAADTCIVDQMIQPPETLGRGGNGAGGGVIGGQVQRQRGNGGCQTGKPLFHRRQPVGAARDSHDGDAAFGKKARCGQADPA